MKKILIVEDQADIRKLLRMTLESGAYEVMEVPTADEAWAVAQRNKPDIVLLDMMMPGTLDGLEVCCRIKTSYDLRHTLVVLLTARDSAEDREAGFNAGADEYLVKPFSPTRLLQILASLERSD
ncbi:MULTISPECIES: response regulator [Delftia]|jgi:DNA-binding response OmpR family regulator|uniref:Response regulator n=2 Tax=Delftia TaxID=80865 RepID=A0AAX3SQY3_9BURK|nr:MULTISPECIES: response regulator [Delftia]KEH09270.1 chemotaxis protein CheY [Delftia tsuruhatensis]KLO61019.1 chemotaxis protein CheY [Delftia tsuruhatensis]MBS3723479.1 Transcriptional regulatory protein SrrA [Delftia sp. PE138]MCO5340447.1 response regulator [Delftia tsuruhatensis]MCR4548279.1 response regulator [Delftia tsuruhatensis]